MSAMLRLTFLPLICSAWMQAGSAAESQEGEELFVRRIAPLFKAKCLACHGDDPAKMKGGLDMRSLESLLQGGESGQPALVAGRPEQSPLFHAVGRSHETWEPMPPKEADRLDAGEMEFIGAWIRAGAPWPDETRRAEIARVNAAKWAAEDGTPVPTSGGLSPEWTSRRYLPDALWAYQPVRRPAVPGAPGRHPVDAFLEAAMPAGLAAAPPADARTFVRRATFDLTGLPPSPEEAAQFERESNAGDRPAVDRLIDRLLASPHYGERMAQHWLDVVRYADSSGFANDYERGNAWRYRDYVVRAFHEDRPYDRFVREQIAGDEIAPGDPELLVAAGFLRMGPWELTAMEVPKVARQRFLDDVTNAVGETFLAHSLQCARCHDHKFDPVPARDYYAVQAVFATTQLAERAAPFLKSENTAGFEERKYAELRRAEHLASLARLDAKLLENARRWYAEQKLDPAKWNAAVAGLQRDGGNSRRGFSDVFSMAREAMRKAGLAEDQYPPKLTGFTPEEFGLERVARKGLERLRWELERYQPFALSVYSGRTPQQTSVNAPQRMPPDRMKTGELEETSILSGGDPSSPGEKVSPGVLSAVTAFNPGAKADIPDGIAGRRKAFAAWVASAENPLTARVMVNRIWMWHFGQPLAGNPNNFGSTGKKPTHPELLDWLAAEFVASGWSVKAMHRLIMSSEAYRRGAVALNRQAAADKDAAGAAYAVFLPRRLTAEELRDAMLAASGELNRTPGGIPGRPEINAVAALQPRQVMGTFAAAWVPNPLPSQRHRRSLYSLKLRGLAAPAMEVFNAPSPDFSCERREVSTVTPQVFTFFNSPASHARSLALAARVLKESRNDSDAIERAFLLVYGRVPQAGELTACLAHWREMEGIQARARFVAVRPPLEVRRNAVEENTGEKFSFTEKLHAAADFVPDLQPPDCDARTRAFADVCLALFNSNEFLWIY